VTKHKLKVAFNGFQISKNLGIHLLHKQAVSIGPFRAKTAVY
jgi:hypothetical protein